MKYKIKYFFNKFYHLIKFIIPAFFIGTLSVNANVVPYECLQYEHYINVGSVINENSSTYSQNRSSDFYNLDTSDRLNLALYDEDDFYITHVLPSYINTCTSQVTDETTGQVTIQNNYKLFEYTSTSNGMTGDIYSLFSMNSNADHLKLNADNKVFRGSNLGAFPIDRTKDKLIYPMYFRSNKPDLSITDVFDSFYFEMDYVNPADPYHAPRFFTQEIDFNDNGMDYIFNYNMYYEQDHFYYYTFDLVIPFTTENLIYDAFKMVENRVGNYEYSRFGVEIYPNLDFIMDSSHSPFGLFMGVSTAFFIDDEVRTGPNWVETGINEWVITNNPSESLGPLEEFFNNFNMQDNRGISQIITIPIRLAQSLLSSSCDNITLDIFTSREDDNITIPSGCSFWSTMTPIKNLINIFVDGFICFEILKAVYLEIDKLKDPTDKSRVERSDL